MNHLNPPKSPHVTNLRDQDEDDEETVRETLRFINSATTGGGAAQKQQQTPQYGQHQAHTQASHMQQTHHTYDPTPPPLPPTPQQPPSVTQTPTHGGQNMNSYQLPSSHIHENTEANEHYVQTSPNMMMHHIDPTTTNGMVPHQMQSTSIIVMTAGVVFVLATILPLSKVAKITASTTKLASSCTPQIETILRTALFVTLFLGSMHAVNKF
jgi:hypothetical protein